MQYNQTCTHKTDQKSNVYIQRFSDELSVLDTAQRPRKLSILSWDGAQYTFLFKSREVGEDLRQNERVVQLFGLMNLMLSWRSAATR